MQAYPLSSPAARIPQTAGPSFPLTTPPFPEGRLAEGPGLVHDAGNLLGAIGLYCDLLNAPGVLRPEHVHYARELRQLSQRSHAMIGRLLHEGSHKAIRTGSAPMNAADVLKLLTPLLQSIASPHAKVSVEMPKRLPRLPFAAEVLERIIVNLARNAATALQKHGADSARIRIALSTETRKAVRYVRLTVTDNGPGMSMGSAASFLKPRPLPAGATHGLGHRIVQELVTTTGGNLCITVSPGRSTTVQIDWPAACARHQEPAC